MNRALSLARRQVRPGPGTKLKRAQPSRGDRNFNPGHTLCCGAMTTRPWVPFCTDR